MNTRKALRNVGIALVGLVLFTALFVFPVWVQNNHIELIREQRQLQSEWIALRNQMALLQKERNALVERERIEKKAREQFGLEYRELPIAVAEVAE